ncbi:MAG: beta-lactamase family protein [Spirochaetia bacterium]|nr:beta-lactamase family protein [Spirochaetia bacterium]
MRVTRRNVGIFARPLVAALLLVGLIFALAAREEEKPQEIGSARDIDVSTPTQQDMDPAPLVRLTEFIQKRKPPVYSLLISRDGKLIYELYTSGLGRDQAHYLMSVTKSFTATLVGIAIDQGLIKSLEEPVSELFPEEAFASPARRAEFQKITLRNVLSMSALDALVPPHSQSAEAIARNEMFHQVPNRPVFALEQKILAHPGRDFQYQDITPSLAIGALFYASQMRAFDFAQKNLMSDLNFKNAEWMHRDQSNIDMGSYGLRLRPVDMQKFGMLYLNRGKYRGKQIISEKWVEDTYKAQIKSSPNISEKNYGNYFWRTWDGPKFSGILAAGWRGQRIAVYPESGIVVTMTGWHSDVEEEKFFATVMQEYVVKSFYSKEIRDPSLNKKLEDLLKQVNGEVNVIRHEEGEERMVPSVDPIEE